MFCVIEEAVSLIFFSKFDSVDIILERRSIAICNRSESNSPISLKLSRSSLIFHDMHPKRPKPKIRRGDDAGVGRFLARVEGQSKIMGRCSRLRKEVTA
jgi:hypothetical protein